MFYDLNFPQWYEGNRNTGGDGNEQPRNCSNWKLYECSKNRYIWKYYLDKEKRILPENATEVSSMTDPGLLITQAKIPQTVLEIYMREKCVWV